MSEYLCYRRDTKERSPVFARYDQASDWAVEKLRPGANAMTVTWFIMRREIVGGCEDVYTPWHPVGKVYTRKYVIVGTGPNVKGVPWPMSTPESD